MTKDKSLDVYALANEVNRESKNGALTQDLLSNGHTLYGINPEFPNLLEQVTHDKRISLGQFPPMSGYMSPLIFYSEAINENQIQ